jgi:hypothetical protein
VGDEGAVLDGGAVLHVHLVGGGGSDEEEVDVPKGVGTDNVALEEAALGAVFQELGEEGGVGPGGGGVGGSKSSDEGAAHLGSAVLVVHEYGEFAAAWDDIGLKSAQVLDDLSLAFLVSGGHGFTAWSFYTTK